MKQNSTETLDNDSSAATSPSQKSWLNFKYPVHLGFLAIVRITVGYHFLSVGAGKLFGNFLAGDSLLRTLSGVAGDPIPIHQDFILNVVIPHNVFFSYLVCYGEVLIGLSLLTGCLVRVASSFGAFHNLNIYLAIAYPAGGSQLALNRLYIVLLLIFVITAAGRSLGLDGWLKKRFPKAWWF